MTPDPDAYLFDEPDFQRLFSHIPQPDPLADHEAVEGIAVMVEQDAEIELPLVGSW